MNYFTTPENFKELCGYEIDGKWYPRVTKIISIKAKPALYRYYGEAASYKAAQESTQKSAEEGTLMHEVVQKIMVGESPEVPPSIAPAVKETIDILERRNIQIDPESIERRIVNFNERYAGTIDATALIDGRFGVLDIKTSQAIYRDYNLQTSAYMDPLSRERAHVQSRWILRIDQNQICNRCSATLRTKGGRAKLKKAYGNGKRACPDESHEWSEMRGVVELKEFPYWKTDYEAFLSAKKLWEWENDYWLRRIGYLS